MATGSGGLGLAFPAFALDWATPAETETPLLLLAGGGGSAKSGVPNCITASRLAADSEGRPRLDEQAMLDTGDQLAAHIAVAPKGGLIAAGMQAHCHLLAFNADATALVDLARFQTDFADEPFENALAFSGSGDRIASGGDDGVVRVWAVRNRSALVRAAAAADDGGGGGGGASKAVRADVQRVCEATGHTKPITDLAFSRAGEFVVSTSRDGTCRVWRADSGVEVASLAATGDKMFFRACAFTPADDILAVQTAPTGPTTLIKFAATSVAKGHTVGWAPDRVLRLSKGPVCAMNKGRGSEAVLAFGSNDGGIIVVDAVKFKVARTHKGAHHLPCTGIGLAAAAEGEAVRVVSVSADKSLFVLDVAGGGAARQWLIVMLLLVLAAVVFGM